MLRLCQNAYLEQTQDSIYRAITALWQRLVELQGSFCLQIVPTNVAEIRDA